MDPWYEDFNISSIIDINTDFYEQVDRLLAKIRLSREDIERMKKLYYDLECVINKRWPGSKVLPFGSVVTGLAFKSSDADCFVDIPAKYRIPGEKFVQKAAALFKNHPNMFTNITSIVSAKVPIVKFYHPDTMMDCDVSFKSPNGVVNSELIGYLFMMDPRIIPLVSLIKCWGKVHNLTGTNMFPNYALLMLILLFLQLEKIIPSVEWMQRGCRPYLIDGWNTSFDNNSSIVPKSHNGLSVHDLLGRFFKFYQDFDYYEYIVCPFLGELVSRHEFQDLETVPDSFAFYKRNVEYGGNPLNISTHFCVQDVFDHARNCAAAVPASVILKWKLCLEQAVQAYEDSFADDGSSFLTKLLNTDPKMQLPQHQSKTISPSKIHKHTKGRVNMKTIKNRLSNFKDMLNQGQVVKRIGN